MTDGTSHRRVVRRDTNWTEREYNREKWPILLAAARRLVAEGERNLARVLHRVVDEARGRPSDGPKDIVVDGARLNLPAAFAFGGIDALIAAEVRSACSAPVHAIVELGAGIGQHLFSVWLSGGPRDIPYIACEVAASGRECAAFLAALEPNMRLTALAFDLREPDFSALPTGDGRIVFFSCHGIEQVPEIGANLFDRIFELKRPVTFVGFEPIGWQINVARNEPETSGSSRAYAEENDYNRNLWPMLLQLRDAGKIEIDKVRINILGHNPKHGVSLVRWRTI